MIEKIKPRTPDIRNLKHLTVPEVSDVIKQALEPFGRYQLVIILLLCFHQIIFGIPDTIPTFYAYTPKNFTCSEVAGNDTGCVPGCTKYEFDDSDTSIVTEWSLVCDHKIYMALSTTIYYIGISIGSIVGGILADNWGRKSVLVMCLYLQGFFGAIVYFAKTYTAFNIIRFVQGIFVQGLQNVTFTLLQELTPTRKLTFTGAFWQVFWGFGIVFLGTVSYFIRDWRVLQLVLTIPTVLTLAYTFELIPESPYWSLTNKDTKTALKVALKIADKDATAIVFKPSHSPQKMVETKVGGIRDLFKNPILLKHLTVMTFAWYSVTVSYYAILFYMPDLPGGRHLNFIISGIIEIFAPYIGYKFFGSSRFGRKYSMMIFQYFTGLFCIFVGLLTVIPNDESWKFYAVIASTIIAKFFAFLSFLGACIYGVELFPTVVRGSACGFGGIASRIGSLLAPQILLLADVAHSTVPMAVIAVSTFIGGTAILAVPETLNEPLTNTLEDVEECWGKQQNKDPITGLKIVVNGNPYK